MKYSPKKPKQKGIRRYCAGTQTTPPVSLHLHSYALTSTLNLMQVNICLPLSGVSKSSGGWLDPLLVLATICSTNKSWQVLAMCPTVILGSNAQKKMERTNIVLNLLKTF